MFKRAKNTLKKYYENGVVKMEKQIYDEKTGLMYELKGEQYYPKRNHLHLTITTRRES